MENLHLHVKVNANLTLLHPCFRLEFCCEAFTYFANYDSCSDAFVEKRADIPDVDLIFTDIDNEGEYFKVVFC